MPTVGEQLRQAREARQLRVQEVAEATKMRSDHILALEEGNYAPFPAPVYVRGSVRTYAKLLNLEVMPIMEALSAELDARAASPGTANRGVPAGRRGVLEFLAYHLARLGWKRVIITLGILVCLILLYIFRVTRSDGSEGDTLSDLPPPTYEPADTEAGYLPLPDSGE